MVLGVPECYVVFVIFCGAERFVLFFFYLTHLLHQLTFNETGSLGLSWVTSSFPSTLLLLCVNALRDFFLLFNLALVVSASVFLGVVGASLNKSAT